ncbi:MAG: penicillin-binding protein 1C [Bacteroidota bacterium]
MFQFLQQVWRRLPAGLRAWIRKRPWKWAVWALLLGLYIFSLPKPLFQTPYSTVLLDQNTQLLGARIAKDGQWRFPSLDSVPAKFATAIVAFEDKRFYHHPGVDPLATARAIRLNVGRGEVVSGGSTLSMQVIRLARQGQARTFKEKFLEMILATRLEWSYSKEEILNLYASHAPFGGNVVGLEAASWKYFGRKPHALSWAESSMLAVLPNSPSLIHPGRNREALRKKRNALLLKLKENGAMDSLTYASAILEPLPDKPLPLPRYADHLLDKVQQGKLSSSAGPNQHFVSTLDKGLQIRAQAIIAQQHERLSEMGIHNAAALVVEVKTGNVLAYVGNTTDPEYAHQNAVDIIPAPRSSGSILKPFLYAAMLDEGEILPTTLIPDVPSYFGGFSPKNYNRTYQGAVPAHFALAQSLNIPSVHMLNQFGLARFQYQLKRMGLTTLHRPSHEYGLTLILGGAETCLWDLAGSYASMARTLDLYSHYIGQYDPHAFRPLNLSLANSQEPLSYEAFDQLEASAPLGAGAIWHTMEAMVEVTRPEAEGYWRNFASSHKIAWKTGTSHGFRDAWSIGCTPDYVVAVWVGNADGEGRPGLVGSRAAAPIMFRLFESLPLSDRWFRQPFDDMAFIGTCRQSGLRGGRFCPEVDTTWVPNAGRKAHACAYHQPIHLDPSAQWRVNSSCVSPLDMVKKTFFMLPPRQAIYYRSQHPQYEDLPPWREDCLVLAENRSGPMQIVYPNRGTQIYVPVELDGRMGRTVFEAVHQDPKATIFWHLDETYVGQTQEFHELGLNPKPGTHWLTLVDQDGQTVSRKFEILPRAKD